MRVLLVGPASDRARLRARLSSRGVSVVAEFSTLASARASDVDHDAIVIAEAPSFADGPERFEQRGRAGLGMSGDEPHPEALTPREIQVVELLAEGLPNKAIAARLAISDQTVKFHVSAICGKLGAANRTDAVRRAVRRGLIAL